MRAALLTLTVLAALGLAGAVSVVGLGFYNVSAHTGHWPGVSWILHTTFRNSVRLRAPSMTDAPRLDDPDLIALGAGHYATACAGCHAAPGTARTATVRAMVPKPPPIGEAVEGWRPNELHWIVENGVKMSGMPGWPAKGRGDEVWAVVAYLLSVRESAAPALPATDGAGAAYCRTCHETIGGPVPRLDILEADYLETQLVLYASGERPGGIMAQAVSRVRQDDFAALARELAQGKTPVPAGDAPRLNRTDSGGAALARRGNRDIPACLACHGKTGKGPALSGQSQDYLHRQLKLWRGGTYDHDKKMHAAARDLTDADIDALSRYFATLGQ